jgi:hypothetical protein
MNKPEDYGVNILITPELIEAIEIVRGTSEPHAVGKLATREHLRAVVGAFMDAIGQIESLNQMLDQTIEAGESCLPPEPTSYVSMHTNIIDDSWLTMPKDTLEDSKLTIKYVNEKLGSNSSLREES